MYSQCVQRVYTKLHGAFIRFALPQAEYPESRDAILSMFTFDSALAVGVASMLLGLSNCLLGEAERIAKLQSRVRERYMKEEQPNLATLAFQFYGCSPFHDHTDARLSVRSNSMAARRSTTTPPLGARARARAPLR